MDFSKMTEKEIIELSMYTSENGITVPYSQVVYLDSHRNSMTTIDGKVFTFKDVRSFNDCTLGKAKYDLYRKSIEDSTVYKEKVGELEDLIKESQEKLIIHINNNMNTIINNVNHYVRKVDNEVQKSISKYSQINETNFVEKMKQVQKIIDSFEEILED